MGRRDYRKGALSYDFVAIPKRVLTGEEWLALPHAARALALDLAAQYTGKNNGRLTSAYEVMKRCGWTSKSTLVRAKRALLEASFVVLTRKGHAPRTTEWIAFTWWRLDYHESMDVSPKAFPYLNFMNSEAARIDPNVGRDQAIRSKQFLRSQDETDGSAATPARGVKTRPTNGATHRSSVPEQHHAS